MMYDGLDRLTSAKGFWGDVSIGYDTLGNITHYNFTDKGTTSYQYDTDNLLTAVSGGVSRSFSYDNRGNVTANGKNTFTYNHANRMATSNVADYTYDGHGRRVKTTSANGTEYSFYDKNGRLVYREKADTSKVNYVFLNKLQVARVVVASASKPANLQSLSSMGGTAAYIHTDLLGSPVVESNQSGQVDETSRMHYRPFGETRETPKDEVGFTGHKFDTDIGLVYAQQRYYDAEIGRFYANDPIGFRDVHSFNRYIYANNNPSKYTDPNGKSAVLLVEGIIATDAAVPEPSDIAWPKWAGYAIAQAGAVAIDAVFNESSDEPTTEPVKDKKRKYTKKDREKMKDAAGGVCEYCGDEVTMDPGTGKSMEGDHIEPWSEGGQTDEENGASTCRDCNRSKGKKKLGNGEGEYQPKNPNDRIKEKMKDN